MGKLWFFFNTVQLGSSFTMFNLVRAPANVSLLKKAYDKIVNLKILPDGFIDQQLANLGINKKVEKPRDDVIDLTEFKQTKFEENTLQRKLAEIRPVSPQEVKKNRLIYILTALGVVAVIAAIIRFRNQIWAKLPGFMRDALNELKAMMIYNGIIRTCIQLFFPMVLVGSLTMARQGKYAVPAIQIIFFVAFFIITIVHIEQNQDLVDTKVYKSKYGSYFTNIETYKKPRALHYTTLFLLRRLIIAFTIAWLSFSNVMQSLIAVHTSLWMLTWLIEV